MRTNDDKQQQQQQEGPSVSFPAAILNEATTTSAGSTSSSQLRRRKPAPKFKNIAKMVMNLQRGGLLDNINNISNDFDDDNHNHHNSARSGNTADGSSRQANNNNDNMASNNNMASNLGRSHHRYASASYVPYTKEIMSHENGFDGASTQLDQANIPMFASPSKLRPTSNFLDHAQHLENLFSTGPMDHFDDCHNQQHQHQQHDYTYASPTMTRSRYGQPTSTPILENRSGNSQGEEVEWNLRSPSSGEGSHHQQQPQQQQNGDDVEAGGSYQNSPYAEDTAPLLMTAAAAAVRRPNQYRRRFWADLIAVLQPKEMVRSIKEFVATTFCLFIVPCLILSAIFFYPLDNPNLQFMPSEAHLAWFLLFAVRQSVTFTLARITQWVLQVLTIRTTLFVRAVGPLLTLVVMQSEGWSCLLSVWGCWNLLLLHGTSPFVRHWLWFTGIRLFSLEFNVGVGILASDLYGRILAAMIVLGVASAFKKTFVALWLSRRMLQYYRGQLEKVMSQVKLVVEVAELASRTEQPGFEELLASARQGSLAIEKKSNIFKETVPTFLPEKKNSKNASTAAESSDDDDDDEDADEGDNDDNNENNSNNDNDADNNSQDTLDEDSTASKQDDPLRQVLEEIELPLAQMKWNELKQRALNDRYAVKYNGDESTSGCSKKSKRGVSARGLGTIFPLLERWQEPDDKGRKSMAPSLHDILQFKKAIGWLDSDVPFSPAYGSASSRKACVKNAVKVYRRLLRYTPDQQRLPFDVIGALAYGEDGEMDEEGAIDLLRVFLPDKDDTLSMLAFVQSCDNVYKQLRFLRASLSNSSKIDSVLENIFDITFYSFLGLVALAVCGFNPWPLLVSFSTLTVSFSFAFGSSIAKYVEGVLLIAVRRPYDIGDRISITGAEQVSNPTGADTWLVDNISLTTTTLRYAATNEQATINNSSVANSRIVNHARSPRASVTTRILFDISATQTQLDDFRKSMERFFEDRPRIWVGLIHFRLQEVNRDFGFVEYLYRAQHVKPWQEMGAIMINKGELERHMDMIGTEMGIVFESLGHGIGPANTTTTPSDDRRRTAQFIRSISAASRIGAEGAKFSSDDVISEYADTAIVPPPGDRGAD